jgi:very-short-patch-repair endonuclease
MKADKSNYYAYNRQLQPYALKLRKRMTKAEACMWKYVLKACKMKGYPFRRQRPVLNYIADFMCKELMLVIEVDGFSHLTAEAQARDHRKQSDLENAGFTVLRFTNEEVLRHIDRVMEKLGRWIEERERVPL